jgi:hypothetical protein
MIPVIVIDVLYFGGTVMYVMQGISHVFRFFFVRMKKTWSSQCR